MIDLKKIQERVLQNKINKGFNTTDIYMELCYTQGELSEVFEAYAKKKNNLGEELADVALYLLGLCEILGVNLEDEITRKLDINEKRKYDVTDGIVRRIDG